MKEDDQPSCVARRDFLKFSTLGIAGLAGAGFQIPVFAALRSLPTSFLSAGYTSDEIREGVVTWLTPAAGILSGDAAFLERDARVTIQPSRSADNKIHGGAIDVAFPAYGFAPESYPTFRAWSVRRDEFNVRNSAAVTFRVPIEGRNGLTLLFTRNDSEEKPSETPWVATPDDVFRLGFASNEPKLRQGTYVVAYADNLHAAPNWRAVPVTRTAEGIAVPNARFDYFVLLVDYAD